MMLSYVIFSLWKNIFHQMTPCCQITVGTSECNVIISFYSLYLNTLTVFLYSSFIVSVFLSTSLHVLFNYSFQLRAAHHVTAGGRLCLSPALCHMWPAAALIYSRHWSVTPSYRVSNCGCQSWHRICFMSSSGSSLTSFIQVWPVWDLRVCAIIWVCFVP